LRPSKDLDRLRAHGKKLRRLLRIYPPLAGAGVRVDRVAEDFSSFDVSMKLHWWNRNYVGTHFGGSLYAMCDPFFMLLLLEQLGPDFVVWDKAATIRFRRPGKGKVTAHFHIPEERIEEIRRAAHRDASVEPTFQTEILNRHGKVVAEVEKLLYVRLKEKSAPPRP